MLQDQGHTIMTLEEAVFKFDLGVTISTEYIETCRSACFKDYECFMIHGENWQISFKNVLFAMAS